MKALFVLSLFGILFCQFVTVVPESEKTLLLIFAGCSVCFIASSTVLIRRHLRHSRKRNQPGEQDADRKPDHVSS